MHAGLIARPAAGPARRQVFIITLILAALFVVAGCGNDEEAQRAADTFVYRTTPEPAPSVTAEPVAVETTVVETATAEPVVEPAAPQPVPVDYAEAEALYHQGRYNEAADVFLAYTTQHSGNAWGHYMLGLSHWKAGRVVEAEEALARTLEIDPEHLKARLNLARVLLDQGRPADALPEARKVTELAPEMGEAYRVLGRAFQNLNRNEEAVDAYREAVRRDPRDVWAMNNLALIYIQQERFGDALPPLARAVSLRDDLAVIQNNLGVALERTGRFKAAGAAYRAAMAADSSHRRASESLARIEGIPDETGFDETNLAELAALFVQDIQRPRGEKTGDETAALEEPQSP